MFGSNTDLKILLLLANKNENFEDTILSRREWAERRERETQRKRKGEERERERERDEK